MRSLLFIFCLPLALSLISCRDYSNRMYFYNEFIPARPYVMKIMKTEYRVDTDHAEIKVHLQIQQKSAEETRLNKNQFKLRIKDQELEHTPDIREKLNIESIVFKSGEIANVTVAFSIPNDLLKERFDLIVDRSVDKKGKASLTLVNLKNAKEPQKTGDQWQETISPQW
jgi:hypothetical protein